MIGKLTGTIDSFATNYAIIDVSGVGYVVFASARTLLRIGTKGDTTALLIDTHVREDHIHLYGFADAAEQQWFRLLTGVQGVGAKVALAILSACPPDKIQLAIAAQDKAVLTQADGVGPKLALRILTELKDKAANLSLFAPGVSPAVKQVSVPQENTESGTQRDAVSALVNLGYGRAEAFTAVANAAQKANDNDRDNLQTIIRLALKELSA